MESSKGFFSWHTVWHTYIYSNFQQHLGKYSSHMEDTLLQMLVKDVCFFVGGETVKDWR